MVEKIIEKIKSIKAIAEKTFIIGCFYVVFCLLMSVFSIKFAALLVGLGFLMFLLMMIHFYGEVVSLQLPTLEEALKIENEEKENKWRRKMETEEIQKGGK